MAQPFPLVRDAAAIMCPTEVTPWDQHLAEIEIPILAVGAAGGAGPQFAATLDLLTSAEVDRLMVGLHPPEEVLLDFGHVDLFTAWNAPELVWQPMLEWIEEHTE